MDPEKKVTKKIIIDDILTGDSSAPKDAPETITEDTPLGDSLTEDNLTEDNLTEDSFTEDTASNAVFTEDASTEDITTEENKAAAPMAGKEPAAAKTGKPRTQAAEHIARKKKKRMTARKRQRLMRKAFAYLVILLVLSLAAITVGKVWGAISRAVEKRAATRSQVVEAEMQQTEALAEESEEEETETETVVLFEPKETSDTIHLKYEDGNGYNSKYAILIDMQTGEIILEMNAHSKMYPASMTKMMELLVAADQLTEEDLQKEVTLSKAASCYAYDNECSVAGFETGEELTMEQLLYGTILRSGGEASYELAVQVAGSMEDYAELMNAKAEEIGIGESSHFVNTVGIYDDEHYSTVYDMAVILKNVMDDPVAREVITHSSFKIEPTNKHENGYTISNKFLKRIASEDLPGEVIAAKTGYIKQARSCAASYYVASDGREYICVTGKAPGSQKCIDDHVKLYKTYAEQ